MESKYKSRNEDGRASLVNEIALLETNNNFRTKMANFSIGSETKCNLEMKIK
jgi:hypothetical protein